MDTAAPRNWLAIPGKKVTEGLDGGLRRSRFRNIFKWVRALPSGAAVIAIGEGLPSSGCIEVNQCSCSGSLRGALPGSTGLVPVDEPEVIMDGEHTLEQCREVTDKVLRTVFSELFAQRGFPLKGMVLKPNMVLPGMSSGSQPTLDQVADQNRKPSFASISTRCCAGDSVPVWRPTGGVSLCPSECDEC